MRPFLMIAAVALSGCLQVPFRPSTPEPEPQALPLMGWDIQPEGPEWTEATLDAINAHGEVLLSLVPKDIDEWCPGYVEADTEDRAAFWTGMFSVLAKHESTWNPRAAGGGGAWIGLVQINPRTAKGYGCNAQSAEELKDGAANLSCAVRIAAHTVPRDGYVGTGSEGLAADWGPFHSERKRSDMVNWTRSQPYCAG